MQEPSPKERFVGFAFLILLLAIAGSTASIVAYRVKSREWLTRTTLEQTYKELRGADKIPTITRPLATDFNDPRQVFVVSYEFNQLVRAFGLVRAVKQLPSENLPLILSVLKRFDGSAAATITEKVSSSISKADSKVDVDKEARRYNTPESRRLERELFVFLKESGLVKDT